MTIEIPVEAAKAALSVVPVWAWLVGAYLFVALALFVGVSRRRWQMIAKWSPLEGESDWSLIAALAIAIWPIYGTAIVAAWCAIRVFRLWAWMHPDKPRVPYSNED